MIDTSIQPGTATEHRGIAVTPLFPRATPLAAYLTLDEALPRGLRVTEIDAAGSVPELAVANPLATDVLLYDGEELLGAKQNRILNVTVLVAAASELRIPVSCVEQGRWHARSADFSSAPHAAPPELRARKTLRLQEQPLARGLAQAEVWDAVAARAARLQINSPTGAQSDLFAAREHELDTLRQAFPLEPGQSGALLALPDGTHCLDYLSRPDAFAALYPKLLNGYLLDALDQLDRPAAPAATAAAFTGVLDQTELTRGPSPGRGTDLRLRARGLHGSGLELDGELLQLSAFTAGTDPATPRPGSIARPSRRRS